MGKVSLERCLVALLEMTESRSVALSMVSDAKDKGDSDRQPHELHASSGNSERETFTLSFGSPVALGFCLTVSGT